MQWWCSATGFPWTWHWQWYPGVHLMLLVLAISWWTIARRGHWSHRPFGWLTAALIVLLGTLDWPIGKLGAGYLASVHTLQFLLLTLAAAPMLICSIPDEGWNAFARSGSLRARVLHMLARPLPGLVCYTSVVIATHFPSLVDSAMTSQLGSLSIDLSWLAAGFFLWWPMTAPKEFRTLGVGGTIGYIFFATLFPTLPAMMMVFSDWPLYRLYEQAPRVWLRFSANDDIKLAGLSMKLIGDIPLWITAAVVFFRGTSEKGELIDT